MDFESISLAARTHCLDLSLDQQLQDVRALVPSFLLARLDEHMLAVHHRCLGQQAAACSRQSQEVQRSDSEGIRTPAGRAQWISSPSP